jgi:hypothetical protein
MLDNLQQPILTEDCPPEEQKRLIKESKKDELILGATYYIISSKWYQAWQSYVDEKEESPKPGPIDNAHLIDADMKDFLTLTPNFALLNRQFQEKADYELIHEDEWRLLKKWYDLILTHFFISLLFFSLFFNVFVHTCTAIILIARYGGGPKIDREVIVENDNKRVEVHLLHLQVYVSKKDGAFAANLPFKTFICSKLAKVRVILLFDPQ